MNPRLRILTQEGRAKAPFLGLIRAAAPLEPFNALMVVTDERKPSRLFKAWFDASFPNATPLDLAEEIVDEGGYPVDYFLDRWAEVE